MSNACRHPLEPFPTRRSVENEEAPSVRLKERGENLVETHPKYTAFSAPFNLYKNLKTNSYIITNFTKRNISQRYNRSFLGYIWTMLEPALLAIVYYLLFIVVANYSEKSYPLWVLLGVIGWGMFARIINSTISSLVDNAGIIKQSNLPLEIFSASSALTNLVLTSASLVIVVPFMGYLGIVPTINLWMLPAAILMLMSSAFGIGLMFASANVVFPDVGHVFRFITRAGFFVSPVMWTYEIMYERAGPDSIYFEMIMFNPVVVPLTMMRHSIEGTYPLISTQHYLYAAIFPIIVLVLGSIIFQKMSRGVVKRL